MTESESAGDDAAALEDLAHRIDDNARDERLLARRVRRLSALRAAGRSWESLVPKDLGVLDLSARILARATAISRSVRRRLAQGLRAEGATIAAIAASFGVSHQRISALLRDPDAPEVAATSDRGRPAHRR